MTFKYSLMQIFYWIMFCALYAFSNSYLSYKGLPVEQIGYILAISSLLSVLFQPIMAKLIDNHEKITVRNTLIFSFFLMFLSCIILFISNIKIINILAYIVLITSLLNTQTFIYVFIFEYINLGENVNFGLSRGLGSISFAIASFIYGKVGQNIGFSFIPIFSALLLIFVILMIFSFKKIDKVENRKEKIKEKSFLEFVKTYPKYCIFLLGIILVFIVHNSLNTFSKDIVEHFNLGAYEVGISFMLAAAVELPVMYSIVYLSKKIGYDNLLKISAVSFFVKILITYIAIKVNNVNVYYIAQLSQMGAYAIYVPVSVYYTNELMQENDRVKAQAYIGVAGTIGIILGNMFGGQIIKVFNVEMLILIGLIITIIGSTIMYMNIEKIGIKRQS